MHSPVGDSRFHIASLRQQLMRKDIGLKTYNGGPIRLSFRHSDIDAASEFRVIQSWEIGKRNHSSIPDFKATAAIGEVVDRLFNFASCLENLHKIV